eukprot:RCo012687
MGQGQGFTVFASAGAAGKAAGELLCPEATFEKQVHSAAQLCDHLQKDKASRLKLRSEGLSSPAGGVLWARLSSLAVDPRSSWDVKLSVLYILLAALHPSVATPSEWDAEECQGSASAAQVELLVRSNFGHVLVDLCAGVTQHLTTNGVNSAASYVSGLLKTLAAIQALAQHGSFAGAFARDGGCTFLVHMMALHSRPVQERRRCALCLAILAKYAPDLMELEAVIAHAELLHSMLLDTKPRVVGAAVVLVVLFLESRDGALARANAVSLLQGGLLPSLLLSYA